MLLVAAATHGQQRPFGTFDEGGDHEQADTDTADADGDVEFAVGARRTVWRERT